MHSISMEEEAFFRLRNYPAQISENMHHALITIPRKLAYLLHQKPAYIAPAVEAFYLRDPIALKPLQNKDNKDKLIFIPQDFVTVSVKFPRVAYAQVKSQEFPAPAVFADAMPSGTDPKAYVRAETGMKVTCGFEMLISDSQYQDRPAVREMKMLLDDLESGDEVLPSDTELATWSHQEDDEKWLDISFDELENELAGRKGHTGDRGKKTGFGDKAAQENLQRIVKQFEEFLNDDNAGPDGAGLFGEGSDDGVDDDELDEDDDEFDDEGEDKEASFGEDEFSKMMQEMMGMPPEVMKEIMMGELGPGAQDPGHRSTLRPPATRTGPVRDMNRMNDDEVDNEADLLSFMKQMEAELRGHGALDLGSSSSGNKQRAIQASTSKAGKEHDEEDEVYELSSDEDIDNEIDVNLAKNLLESLKAQAGKAGPGGNLMGMMGLRMPKDEPDEDDDDNQAGPSGTQGMTGGMPRIEELK
ncbi:uncharacterized protein PV07_07623 [Cladophialophora immunda]|uniref:Uncharacterized protein n=1 Tax=Cladophialophora immunda TaxID=569365 RepID=A0A0D2AS33_9EURO|nr:uncharacterized protein PV07_07623 [Cladophialophora immunda]KIW27927.1 hypothetical protein PV07_07623 [Cladophialophora immunda]